MAAPYDPSHPFDHHHSELNPSPILVRTLPIPFPTIHSHSTSQRKAPPSNHPRSWTPISFPRRSACGRKYANARIYLSSVGRIAPRPAGQLIATGAIEELTIVVRQPDRPGCGRGQDLAEPVAQLPCAHAELRERFLVTRSPIGCPRQDKLQDLPVKPVH